MRQNPILQAIDVLSRPTPAVSWLMRCADERQQREQTREAMSPRPVPQIRREPVGERNRKIARILARDGDGCCYCGNPLGEDMTLEHRIAQSNGGSDDLGNLKLAHGQCNRRVGNLPPDMKDELAAREIAQPHTPRDSGGDRNPPETDQ